MSILKYKTKHQARPILVCKRDGKYRKIKKSPLRMKAFKKNIQRVVTNSVKQSLTTVTTQLQTGIQQSLTTATSQLQNGVQQSLNSVVSQLQNEIPGTVQRGLNTAAEQQDALLNEVNNALSQTADATVGGLNAALAAQFEATAITIDASTVAEEIEVLEDPELLQEIALSEEPDIPVTPPAVPLPPKESLLIANIQASNAVTSFAGEEDDDDDDGQQIEMLEEQLVIARMKLPQFRLGVRTVTTPIKIPAKAFPKKVGPFSATISLPSFKIGPRRVGGGSQSFSVGPFDTRVAIDQYTRRLPVPQAVVEVRETIQIIYVNVQYPSVFKGVVNVKAEINDCFNQAKDEAIQQLLIFVAFATTSGGGSVLAGIRQAITTFQQKFTDCIQTKLEGLKINIGTVQHETIFKGPYKRLSLYKR